MSGFLKGVVAFLLCTALVGFGILVVSGRHGNTVPRRAAPAVEAAQDDAGRTSRETQAVLRGVRGKARPATDEDAISCAARKDMEALYAAYHPYFVRGDLNGDGLIDFVQAYVEERNGGLWFDVAVFFGRPDGGFEGPIFVERGISLARGDLSVDRSLLVLTPDLSADDVRRWRYEPLERRFVDADAGPHVAAPDDEDAPEETPDGKIGTRA